MAKPSIPILNKEEIDEKLKELPGWEYKDVRNISEISETPKVQKQNKEGLSGNKLIKEFKFEDYPAVINFIDCLTEVFQETDHHPDIHIYYTRVVFELNTHSAGNRVTEVDFIVASEIERIFNESNY